MRPFRKVPAGVLLVTGGLAGQLLAKQGEAPGAAVWVDPPTGTGGPIYLKSELVDVVARRAPAVPGYGENFGGGLYRTFAPTAPFTLTGIRDSAPNGALRGAVWEVGVTGAPVALGSVADTTSTPYTSVFDPPLELAVGKTYLIGTYLTAGGSLKPGSDNGVLTTYPGFNVGTDTHYPGGANSGYPGPTIGSNVYPPTFDLLSVPTGHVKGVQGPLDPDDLPAGLVGLPPRTAALEGKVVGLSARRVRLSAIPPTRYRLFNPVGAQLGGASGPTVIAFRALAAVTIGGLIGVGDVNGAGGWPLGQTMILEDSNNAQLGTGVWVANPDGADPLTRYLQFDHAAAIPANTDFHIRMDGINYVNAQQGAGTVTTDGSIRFVSSNTYTCSAFDFVSGPALAKQVQGPLDPDDLPADVKALPAKVAALETKKPRLSALAPVLLSSVPAPVPELTNGYMSLTEMTPINDFVFGGVQDTTQGVTGLRFFIFRVSDGLKIFQSAPTVTVNDVVSPAQPITLKAGIVYALGWGATYSANLSVSGPASIFPGFNATGTWKYSSVPGDTNPPVSPYGGTRWPTWKMTTGGENKGVQGPLDPADFPIVSALAELPVGALALLDDGIAAPRLIRKRPDGTIWQGAPFTVQAPDAFSSYRLKTTAGGDGSYYQIYGLELHAVVGGPDVATGGAAFDNGNLGAGYDAAAAFDHTNESAYTADVLPTSGSPRIVGYTLSNAVKLLEYSIYMTNGVRAPRAWTLEGSNDGQAWIVLDTQSNINFANGQTLTFAIPHS